MASHHGRHSAALARTRRLPSFPFKRAAASVAAGLFALGLASTMAIPAMSAAATDSAGGSLAAASDSLSVKSQKLSVSDGVTASSVTRDSSTIMYPAAVRYAAVDGTTASPATPLSVGQNMVISPARVGGGGDAVVAFATQFVGMVPYIRGGTSPSTGFTCDTFVRYVYKQFGVTLSGDADVEAHQGQVISESEAVAGDLVYYPHQHIGIYDGNGGIVDAPKPGTDVSHRLIWGSPLFIRL